MNTTIYSKAIILGSCLFGLCLCRVALAATSKTIPLPSFQETCALLTQQSLPGGTLTVAQYLAAGRDGAYAVPEHCKLQGKLNEHTGIDGKPYAIGFELRLPKAWNQRFYFQGGGGTDGVLRPALGMASAGNLMSNALTVGFAVVSTDAGHLNQPGVEGSYLFGADPQARIDYGYNHLPVVTAAAKNLIAKMYGRMPHHAYFVGCSNGGRQGMMATQRFPTLFDGVIAGAPAYRAVEASLDAMAQVQAYANAAPASKTSDARPLLGNAFTAEDLTFVSKGVLLACDALDGAADGMVNDIRNCHFDASMLQCVNDEDGANCLSEKKVTALKDAFAGARANNGQLIYASWPFDPGIASPLWSLWKFGSPDAMPPQAMNTTLVAGTLSHVFMTPPQMTADLYGFALSVQPETAFAQAAQRKKPFMQSGIQVMNADSSDIAEFKNRGGKIIFYHGMADGAFSANDTVSYFQQLRTRFGKDAEKFSRLYLIPGMAHCSGGPATDQFDALSALIAWVEEGKAPDALSAKAGSSAPWPGRTRPLCAYPTQAMYSGKGNIEDAANFTCR